MRDELLQKSCRILIDYLFYTNFRIVLLPTSRSLKVSCFLQLSSLLSFRLTKLITCHCH